jgi:uncharacterized phiE125 gp8 family phage protein
MIWNHHRLHGEVARRLYLVSAPESDVVSLDDVKKHLAIQHDDDNDLIQTYIDAVVSHLDGRDGELGRALIDQTWELRLSSFPGPCIDLPLPPLIEVVSISYYDGDGNFAAVDEDAYSVLGVGDRGRIELVSGQSWPTIDCTRSEPIIIQFRAGYLDGSVSPPEANVPAAVVAAIKLMVGSLYMQRESIVVGQEVSEVPAAQALLRPYRIWSH